MDALRSSRRVLPPTAYFFHEQKKYAKTPVETHGFHPSFTRLNPSNVGSAYIANRNAVTSGWKCCTAATSLFAAAPLKNVGAGTSTVCKSERLSGLEGSQCNILPRKDAVPIRVAGNCPCLSAHRPRKGGQGTMGALRRFFGDFLSLVKESYSSKTGQDSSITESSKSKDRPKGGLFS